MSRDTLPVSPNSVSVLLPAFNEAGAIQSVITDFQSVGLSKIVVIDGGSSDSTRELARDAGATVVQQSGEGKGQAVREAFADHLDTPYVLMADADGTYSADDAAVMLQPLADGADHVVGKRDYKPGESMPVFNAVGNRVMNGLFSVFHGAEFGDLLSGYRAFTRDAIADLSLSSSSFGIETEIAVETVRNQHSVAVVPVSYQTRSGDTESNLHPVADGGEILSLIMIFALRTSPVRFFGLLSVPFLCLAAGIAGYTGYDWFVNGVGHESLVAIAGLCVTLAVQMMLFAVLVTQINRAIQELTSR